MLPLIITSNQTRNWALIGAGSPVIWRVKYRSMAEVRSSMSRPAAARISMVDTALTLACRLGSFNTSVALTLEPGVSWRTWSRRTDRRTSLVCLALQPWMAAWSAMISSQ